MTDSQGIKALLKQYEADVAEYNALPAGSKTQAAMCQKFYSTLVKVEDVLKSAPSGDPTTANLPAMPSS